MKIFMYNCLERAKFITHEQFFRHESNSLEKRVEHLVIMDNRSKAHCDKKAGCSILLPKYDS